MTPTPLKMLGADDKIAEIRRLYFETTRQTIERDLEKALSLLKSMPTEEERERATVFMEGLAEMRRDWVKTSRPPAAGKRAKPSGASAERRGAKPQGGRKR
ncbi:MAG: hypothetical protein AB7Q29_06090 [Vicinamibacterales bacterium]